jgi:DNA-binding response OmpR family regulator
MEAEGNNGIEHTVLVVADDLRLLYLVQAVLASKGHRVLLASDAESATQLLSQSRVPIHSVAIRAGLSGHEELYRYCLRRGAKAWTLHCSVDDRSVRLEGLDSGADWESAADDGIVL